MTKEKQRSKRKKDWTVRNHARLRAAQRYGAKRLSKEDLDKVVAQIKAGEAILVEGDPRQKEGTTQWLVIPEWSDFPVRAVYAANRDQIVTFLPQVGDPAKLARLVRRT